MAKAVLVIDIPESCSMVNSCMNFKALKMTAHECVE